MLESKAELERIAYSAKSNQLGEVGFLPLLPLTLRY
jgi:hypothetical protein